MVASICVRMWVIRVFAELQLIDIFDMYQEMKRLQWEYNPYIMQDQGGY